MESDTGPNHSMMIEHNVPRNMQIDPSRARFPCCIVWTPLPVISWLLPFVGHIGIAREDGVILDFAGPNFVCVDNFTFGAVARYIQISKEKCSITPFPSTMYRSEEEYRLVESGRNQHTWDDALKKSTQEYQHRTYNILTCNCHSFVANNLNRLELEGGGWNVVNVAALILLKGQWIVVDFAASWCGPCRVIAPFVAELAKKMPHVTFLKVDVDELKEIASDWGVEAMPTFLLLKDGKTVTKVVGAKKEELQQTIIKHAGNSSASA